MLPTGPSFAFKVVTKLTTQPTTLAVFLAEGAKGPAADEVLLGDIAKRAIARLILSRVARGRPREIHFDLIDDAPRGRPTFQRVYVAGLGPARRASAEAVRQAAGTVARAVRKHRLRDVVVALPVVADAKDLSPAVAAEAIVAGLLLAGFDFDEFKGAVGRRKDEADAAKDARTFTLLCGPASADAVRAGVERGRVLAEAQNFARTIASRPGNVINPPSLAKVAQEMAKEVGLGVRVLDERQMEKLGMGGILAVGAGSSATPPRMIVLEHRPGVGGRGTEVGGRGTEVGGRRPEVGATSASRSSTPDVRPPTSDPRPPLLVVGKAITFDTGGISIKSADKMGRMIFDKCGGMAVLGLMYAAARLNLPVPVVGILAAAENHISESAYRPGDILRMYNGVTVEVTNTDAEGRLVLADALAWGIETYKPAAVVDLATLTGGVVVALGKTMAGLMSNSDPLAGELAAAAGRAGEKLWRLPIGEDQREYIKSEPADIVNSGGREGSPLQGGAFLSYFVPGGAGGDPAGNGAAGDRDLVPWAHLDIAGVADTEKELPYYAKGATGWGVRTLVEWAAGRAGEQPRR